MKEPLIAVRTMTEGPDVPFELAQPKRTWQEEVRAMMDADIVLYQRKDDPGWNAARLRKKEEVIGWVISQLEKGW